MKTIHQTSMKCLFPTMNQLLFALFMSMIGVTHAQTLLSSNEFFNPDFEARRPGSGTLLLTLDINTTLYSPGSSSQGDMTWNHRAGGLVQIGADVLGLATADVQLAAYTRTQNDTLVFGRELVTTTGGLLGVLGSTVTDLTDQVVGASAINSWSSTAIASNQNLTEGILYSASFTVQAGSGIDVDALSYANFTLLNGAVPVQSTGAVETLDLLSLLQLGSDPVSINFEFIAPAGFNELTFQFDAATIADVNLLGSISGNQTVLEFSNFSLAPVPEPGSLVLFSTGMLLILRRRRPCQI